MLQWARMLQPRVRLGAISSRGFAPGWELLLPDADRLALNIEPGHGDGVAAMARQLPRVGAWLAQTDADWLHAHYLTSHGTLAWAAKLGWRLRAQIAGSAWGNDIFVTPNRGGSWKWLTKKALKSCDITTSDSTHMAQRMHELGAGEVMVFPSGLDALPRQNAKKQPWLCFFNRELEPTHRPQLAIDAFARIAAAQPGARLVVANDGSLRAALEADVAGRGLAERVNFVGRLDAATQATQYARSTWMLGLPESDSFSVLEAMAHGCVPVLSELPANRELIGDSARGLIVGSLDDLPARMATLDTARLAVVNRDWVAAHGMFEPHVQRFLTRLRELST